MPMRSGSRYMGRFLVKVRNRAERLEARRAREHVQAWMAANHRRQVSRMVVVVERRASSVEVNVVQTALQR